MAKKKLKSLFTAKLTKAQIIFSCIFIIILFSSLGLYFLYNQTAIRLRAEAYTSIQIVEGNYISYLQSLTPTPTVKPTPIVVASHLPPPHWLPCGQVNGGCTAYYQHLTPTPIEQLPNQNFKELEIYQEGPPPGSSFAAETKRITNPTQVNELYGDIQNLPLWPQGVIYHCGDVPVNRYIYKLKFYTNSGFFVYAELDPNGCPGVTFAGEYTPRMAMNPQGNKLINDLQQTLNLSKQEFYSY